MKPFDILDTLDMHIAEIYNSDDKSYFTVEQQFTALFIRDLAEEYSIEDYLVINYKLEKHINYMLTTLQKLGFMKVVSSKGTFNTGDYFYNKKLKGVAIKLEHKAKNKNSLKITKVSIDELIDKLGNDYIKCNEQLDDIDELRQYESYRERLSRIELESEISESCTENSKLECTSVLNSLSDIEISAF